MGNMCCCFYFVDFRIYRNDKVVTTLAQPCILKLSQGCDKVVRTLSHGYHIAPCRNLVF